MTTHAERLPVVIVGAGPVGLTTALMLAKAGVRSVVLEKKGHLDPHSHATLIVPRSLELFDDLGILDAFLAEGERNDAIRMLRASDHKELLRFDFAPLKDRTPTPFALALSQDRTEAILLNAVLATGLVEVAFSTPFERFEAMDGGIRVRAGQGREVKGSFLVGADGAHSAVREQLGWELEGKTYPTRAVLCDVRIGSAYDTTKGWLADPQAPSFTIGIRFASGIWRIIEASVPDGFEDASLPARARSLAEGLFGKGAWRETMWSAVYSKHERRSPRFVQGNVALAGDAAHLNSPAGGQGMNAGLADAGLLALTIMESLTLPHKAELLLANYERTRIEAFDHDIRGLTNALESIETSPEWARRLGFSALGLLRGFGLERVVAEKLSMLGQQTS